MKKYNETLEKLRVPKKFNFIDLVALAALLCLMVWVLSMSNPIDLSAGFNEGSDRVASADHAALTEAMLDQEVTDGYFSLLFESSNAHSGGYVFHGYGGDYIIYDDLDEGKGYYLVDQNFVVEKALKSNDEDLPMGIATRTAYLTVEEDGTVYFDNLSGKYGPTALKLDFPEEPDYEEVFKLLLSSDSEALPLKDAVWLLKLIEDNTLVGYSDAAAYFKKVSGGKTEVHKVNNIGHEVVLTLEGEPEKVMVIDERYIVYMDRGDVHCYVMKTGEGMYMGVPEYADWGELKDIGYAMMSGNKILVCGLTENEIFYFILSGWEGTLEKQGIMENVPAGNLEHIFAITIRDTIIWVTGEGTGYYRYTIEP